MLLGTFRSTILLALPLFEFILIIEKFTFLNTELEIMLIEYLFVQLLPDSFIILRKMSFNPVFQTFSTNFSIF